MQRRLWIARGVYNIGWSNVAKGAFDLKEGFGDFGRVFRRVGLRIWPPLNRKRLIV
jgi:hypothetical protein